MPRHFRAHVGNALIASVLALAAVAPALAASGSVDDSFDRAGGGCGVVLPPNSHAFGKSMGEWVAEWWRRAFSIPTPVNPLLDLTGANATQGQSGNVWFIGGGFCTEPDCSHSTVVRHVAVPDGVALFFPIINNECSTLEGNGTTDAELRACAAANQDLACCMSCEIDGKSVADINSYRVQSPEYTHTLPDNNLFQFFGLTAPAGTTSPSVSDGVYRMLHPLSTGNHVLHFAGQIPTFNFGLDITYYLKVGSQSKSGQDDALPAQVTATRSMSWGGLKTIYR